MERGRTSFASRASEAPRHCGAPGCKGVAWGERRCFSTLLGKEPLHDSMRLDEMMDLHRFCSCQVFILGGPLFEGRGGFPAEG